VQPALERLDAEAAVCERTDLCPPHDHSRGAKRIKRETVYDAVRECNGSEANGSAQTLHDEVGRALTGIWGQHRDRLVTTCSPVPYREGRTSRLVGDTDRDGTAGLEDEPLDVHRACIVGPHVFPPHSVMMKIRVVGRSGLNEGTASPLPAETYPRGEVVLGASDGKRPGFLNKPHGHIRLVA